MLVKNSEGTERKSLVHCLDYREGLRQKVYRRTCGRGRREVGVTDEEGR